MINRYLLCIPLGGLNDTLEQINRCIEYAQRYHRIIFIDTRASGLMGEFNYYFDFINLSDIKIISSTNKIKYDYFNKLLVIPSVLFGNIDNMKISWNKDIQKLCAKDTNIPITFDFDLDYDELLLVHRQDGGGNGHRNLLKHLRFSKEISQEININLKHFPCDYSAIHVRNTDYKSDYLNYFQSIKISLDGKNIFIASDDEKVIEFSKYFFDRSKIFTLHRKKNLNGKPLHLRENYSTQVERLAAVTEALIDLILLANSDKLFYPLISKGFHSGFSRIAQHLNNNKILLKQLLSN